MAHQSTHSNALWHLSSSTSSLLSSAIPAPKEGQCLVKSEFSLISLGTERLVASGAVPVDLHQNMRVPYMEGSFELPVKYGYSLVGQVVTQGYPLSGKKVHLMHPHQSYCIVEAEALTLIPEKVPIRRAVLASNLETAVNAVWDSQVQIGDRVLVVGFGMIGALTALLLQQIAGVEVYIAERLPQRRALAQQLDFQLLAEETDFDITFHTSSSSSGLQMAIDRLGYEGTSVELSWYGTKEVSMQLGASFHQQRKRLIASQVGQVPGSKQNRWDYRRRKQLVFQLLQQEKFDQLLTHEISLSEAPALFGKLREGTLEGIGWTIKYD
ncbi:MAG: zinc-binding alcohol dehydrogenase [Bacteroidota bacterium]